MKRKKLQHAIVHVFFRSLSVSHGLWFLVNKHSFRSAAYKRTGSRIAVQCQRAVTAYQKRVIKCWKEITKGQEPVTAA
jgi:hypothetical protein